MEDFLLRKSSPNEVIAKIRLLETNEAISSYNTTIKKGRIRIIEVLGLSSPEFSPEIIKRVLHLPDSKSLTGEKTRVAKEILDLHIEAGTPDALTIFEPEELTSFIRYPFSPRSKNKILSYLKKKDKSIYTEAVKTLKAEQKKGKETSSTLFIARLMETVVLVVGGIALMTTESFPKELAAPVLLMSVVWLLVERAFGDHGETTETILLMSAILVSSYYGAPEEFLEEMSENFYEIGAVIIGVIALIKYINRNRYF